MSDETKRIYEGLFLFPQSAASDLQGAVDHVTALLERAGAEIVSLGKWDERRLAYEIKGNKRGVYFLVYFHALPSQLMDLERASNLSEQLLRSMVTRGDHLPREVIEVAEGRAKLADEIRLKGTEKEATTPTSSVARKEAAPPVEAATTPAPAAPATPAPAAPATPAPAVEPADA